MLRVLLVDDELMALEGLQLLIDWEKEGFTIAGCCQSGKEALACLSQTRPDLIVTDLSMPEIDGLTLIRAAKERGYTGKFLIVSGYGDFEKARQALSLGVGGYILKPIDPDDAARAIDGVRKALLSRKREDFFPIYHREVGALLTDRPFAPAAIPTGGEWRLATWGSPLQIETLHHLQTVVSSQGSESAAYILDEREWLVLYAPANTDEAIRRLREALAALGRTLSASEAIHDPASLSDARKALNAQLSRCAEEIAKSVSTLEHLLTMRQEDALIAHSEGLQAFCAARGRRACKQATAMWRACCAHQFDHVPDKLAAFVLASHDASDIVALSRLTVRLLYAENQRISDVICEFAKSHYGENLTLDKLAVRLGYNPAYLGRVFRRETGMAFRTWLTELRMKKASELLRRTQTPIFVIARTVGFMKYQYFLDTFKALYHSTPDAYRRGE